MFKLSALETLEYDLIVIEDGDVPLASGFYNTNYYTVTLVAILLLLIVGALVVWFMKRHKYVERLVELKQKVDRECKIPLTIRSIKDEIAIMECELAASII